jgi:hypothetical protein
MVVLIWEAIIIIRNFISLPGLGVVRCHLRLRRPRRGHNLFIFCLPFFVMFNYYYTNNKANIYVYIILFIIDKNILIEYINLMISFEEA